MDDEMQTVLEPSLISTPAQLPKVKKLGSRLWWQFWKLKKKEDKKEFNAYVADFKNGLDLEYIEPDLIPGDSREREYQGRFVHVLSRKDGKLGIVESPQKIGDNESPKDVYNALNCPEVEIVFGIPDTLWNKLSHVALYVLIGADLIFVFLIWGVSLQ